MTAPTFETIVSETITDLHLVDGTGVQQYGEDIVASKVQATFDMIFTKMWVKEYLEWFTRTLDGTNGHFTVQLTTIREFDDIRVVFVDGTERQVLELPDEINPNNLVGTSVLYREADTDDNYGRVVFWPKTATTIVDLQARIHPGELTADDSVYVDKLALKFGTIWQVLEVDGDNPNAAAMYQRLFEARIKQLTKKGSGKIPLNGRSDPAWPTQWFGEGTYD
jgi:hypothetical protein|tara:strand:- start:109 stop:774 length:666 start_codon:yes stop_codon:yes gene_type:complete